MRKVIEEVKKSHIFCQVNNILNTQNSPSTSFIHNLSLNILVLVFHKENASQSG